MNFNNIFEDVGLKTLNHAITGPNKVPVELNMADFLYEAIDVSKFIDIKSWSLYFDAVPVDPYIKDGYRYKSIAWFRVKHQNAASIAEIDEHIAAVNTLSNISDEEGGQYLSTGEPSWRSTETGYSCWYLPQYAMQQSIKYNPVHGDMRREYAPISNNITGSNDFHQLLTLYAAFFGWSDAIVLVQFQRVDCYEGRIGLPAVEGFHQDGNRHVGMLVVDRNNVTDDSGVSQYIMDDNGKKTDDLVFNSVIPAGQLIFWNDKKVWHYGTELKVANAAINNGRGTRDIILLSAKTPPANMPMGPVPEKFRRGVI
jgi:hypothetical protein